MELVWNRFGTTEPPSRVMRQVKKPGFDSLLGKTPDGFVVLKEVGQGASSTVYQAMQPSKNNRLVALKVMSAAEQRLSLDGREDRNPFERDAAISHLVRDPALVRIYRTGRLDDGRYYVAMEYVDGMTIGDELAHRGQVPWPEAVEITQRLARAAAALHQQQIVHRDLQPGNIMLRFGRDGQLHVKLIDLGLARLGPESDDATSPVDSSQIGTPRYMAPEQAAGEGTSFLTDVYAIGAILYEMVCGKPIIALDRPSPEGFLEYLRSNRPLPSISVRAVCPDVPPPISRFMTTCVSRNRHERPADGAAMNAELASLLASHAQTSDASRSVVGRLAAAVGGLLGRRGR